MRSDKVDGAQPTVANVRPVPSETLDSDDNDDDDDIDCKVVNGGRESQELVLRIVRDVGVGLGLSIIGSVRTTAFKDDDEVC